ncbi:MAG: zinc-binding dehydrogenase, partial [Acidobacteria bacterium]|nr:zinc-binding dehydrogenase [Acidobacteriota bacterium]
LAQLGLASLRQTRYEPGENVLVIGLGVIGLSTVALARAMGARVAGIANASLRAELAIRVGAHGAFTSDSPDPQARLREVFEGSQADIVILTANPWSAYRLALESARDGGRVSLLGFPGRGEAPPDFNPLDPRWIYAKQLAVFGSGYSPRTDCPASELRFNVRRNLEYILSLLAAGSMDFSPLISHRIPAGRMREAYELARNRSKELVAATFEWQSR